MDELMKKILLSDKDVKDMSEEEQNEFWDAFKKHLDDRFENVSEEDKEVYYESIHDMKEVFDDLNMDYEEYLKVKNLSLNTDKRYFH